MGYTADAIHILDRSALSTRRTICSFFSLSLLHASNVRYDLGKDVNTNEGILVSSLREIIIIQQSIRKCIIRTPQFSSSANLPAILDCASGRHIARNEGWPNLYNEIPMRLCQLTCHIHTYPRATAS
jgi:hypothetical protein